MRLKRTFLASLLATPALLFINSAYATPVTGQANIAGNVTVSSNAVTFAPTFGQGAPGSMETGDFTGLTGGTIQSLSGGPVTGFLASPIVGFINFTTGLATPITFDLTYIAPGVGTNAACSSSALGTVCTPTGSPFTLFQLSSNTVILSLQLNGNSYLSGTSASGTSSTTSIFSTQAVNGTVPAILAQLASGTPVTGVSYSATFTATPAGIPEPASIMLMGIGLIGAGLVARRKARG